MSISMIPGKFHGFLNFHKLFSLTLLNILVKFLYQAIFSICKYVIHTYLVQFLTFVTFVLGLNLSIVKI